MSPTTAEPVLGLPMSARPARATLARRGDPAPRRRRRRHGGRRPDDDDSIPIASPTDENSRAINPRRRQETTMHTTDTVGTPGLAQTVWRLDPDRSSIQFHTKNLWGMETVKGRFARYHGTLDLSGPPAVELTIDADTLDTGNKRRDKHLRSPDFFDVARHPYVRFASEQVTIKGDQLRVRGHLHARGTSIPLDVEATLRRDGDELEIDAITAADHRQLGMTWSPLAMLRTPSTLIVRGRLHRDA